MPHCKRSINLAYLENDTFDQNAAHPEQERQFFGLEIDDELATPTKTATTSRESPHKLNYK